MLANPVPVKTIVRINGLEYNGMLFHTDDNDDEDGVSPPGGTTSGAWF
jgi:hypothetical protein